MSQELHKISNKGEKIDLRINKKTKIMRTMKDPVNKQMIVENMEFVEVSQKILYSKVRTRKTEIKAYKTLTRPILIYGAEVSIMTKYEEEKCTGTGNTKILDV